MRNQMIYTAALVAALMLVAGCKRSSESTGSVHRDITLSAAEEAEMAGDNLDRIVRTNEEWRKILTPEQYHVTREKGTERAYSGEYWDLKDKGTYLCVSCDLPLFSSDTKFDSGTGWPSFWAPISERNIKTEEDRSLFVTRTEVLCRRCDAHLGHVFDDGPPPTGLRYCMNSVALKFEKAADEKAE